MRTKTLTALLALISSASLGAAAEKVRYEDLRHRLTQSGATLEHRSFTVVTLDGKSYKARTLQLTPDGVRISSRNGWDDVPADEVARIEIRQRARFLHNITDSAIVPFVLGAYLCSALPTDVLFFCWPPAIAVFSPVWAYTAATAPFILAADGVAFLIPPKVYEIIH